MSPETIRAILEARERREHRARNPWAESDQVLVLALQIAVALVLLAICIHGLTTNYL